jgi:DeoR/GlpR family transcriptional regulator of sugar metabolism
MDTGLFPAERHQQILTLLAQAGRVAVGDLSQRFSVSEVTIRADLQELAEQGLLIRTHGGAVPADRAPELALNLRRQQQVAEKDRIGAAAAAAINHGEAVFLDTSSTSLAIAQNLKRHRDLTILTNSLALAQSLINTHSITVVLAGGTLQRDTMSLVGPDGLDTLKKFNIQKGFFGAHGLDALAGLTDVSAAEAEVKRQVIPLCREVIAVLDATKWGRVGLASFARLDQLRSIVTNEPIPPTLAARVRELGVQIIIT